MHIFVDDIQSWFYDRLIRYSHVILIGLVNLMRFVYTFIGKLREDVGCCKGCIQSNIHIKLCATNRIDAILDTFYSILLSQDLGYCSQGFKDLHEGNPIIHQNLARFRQY